MTVYYEDEYVTVHHGKYRDVLPTLDRVQHVICDPLYSEHVHGAARSQRMISSNDRGGKYGADVRRNIELGFDHLKPEDLYFLSEQFARLAERWVLVFSDSESHHLWADGMGKHGLDYVRTGAWIKVGSTPQFSGDRPATGFEAVTIMHQPGRKRWNGGGKHAVWTHAIVLNRGRSAHRLDGRLHTTQKPLPLMVELVEQFTDPGDLILDATAGSGTTGVAAKMAGRRAVLVEQSEAYCQTMAERLQRTMPPMFDLAPHAAPETMFDFEGKSA
jgi:site-specific DNA-methyltransferase (adenine-specific)